MFGSNTEKLSGTKYDPQSLDLSFRFTEANFDFINLNDRDWSLVEIAGIPLGFCHKISALEKELCEQELIIDYLVTQNRGLSQPYGKTPWPGDRG